MQHVEHSLALQHIAKSLRDGYSKECATTQAAKFIKTQGFGMKYSKDVAKWAADQL